MLVFPKAAAFYLPSKALKLVLNFRINPKDSSQAQRANYSQVYFKVMALQTIFPLQKQMASLVLGLSFLSKNFTMLESNFNSLLKITFAEFY